MRTDWLSPLQNNIALSGLRENVVLVKFILTTNGTNGYARGTHGTVTTCPLVITLCYDLGSLVLCYKLCPDTL